LENKRELRRIPIRLIDIPEVRASSKFTEEQEAFFRYSAEKYGILQPILVRPKPDGRYELIAGKHRLLELEAQGKSEADCIIIDADQRDALMMHIAENLARGEADPISVARVLAAAISAGADEEEIAKATGHTVSWVRFKLSLLKLPEVYQEALMSGELSEEVIKQASRLPDVGEMDYALTQALRLGWSGSVVKHYVDRRLDEIRFAREQAEKLKQPEQRPEPDAQKLLQYERCMICDRTVLRQDVFMNLICADCRDLAKYIIENVGQPDQAINTIYEALLKFQEYQKYLELKAKYEKFEEKALPERRESYGEEGA